jgi:DUF971 family protein
VAGPHARTIEIFPNGEVGIVWEDGREDFHGARALRLACPCAQCVDELTGEKRLDPARIPAGLRVLGWVPIGHYAVRFRWSDGHDTGLFTFEHLRGLER